MIVIESLERTSGGTNRGRNKYLRHCWSSSPWSNSSWQLTEGIVEVESTHSKYHPNETKLIRVSICVHAMSGPEERP